MGGRGNQNPLLIFMPKSVLLIMATRPNRFLRRQPSSKLMMPFGDDQLNGRFKIPVLSQRDDGSTAFAVTSREILVGTLVFLLSYITCDLKLSGWFQRRDRVDQIICPRPS